MNTRIFEAFETRERQVSEYMAGCGRKYGMPCTCGPECRCANCSEHCKTAKDNSNLMETGVGESLQPVPMNQMGNTGGVQHMDGFNMAPAPEKDHMPTRNPSIISFGGNMRHMSITSASEATFGRAMSGLSALSIDWENMEDFDVNVDHSAHIVHNPSGPLQDGNSLMGGNLRRSSLRRSFNTMNTDDSNPAQVSFKV